MRDMNLVARREWPPKSKKLSNTPTFSRFNNCPTMAANFSSVSLRGATYSVCRALRENSGAGNALRSTLPLGVKGMACK